MNKFRKLFYLGLESYESRYTLQLQEWTERVFKKRDVSYEVIYGKEINKSNAINVGSVLDAHNRCYYSLTQVANLVELMQAGKVTNEDIIFVEDMFTPGLESLPYIMDQVEERYRPQVWTRAFAQSVDPDDFINREGMLPWMRHYEKMLDNFLTGLVVANEEFVAYFRTAGFKCPIYVVGLPFGKEEVQERVPERKPLQERKVRVAFSARWDDEKQPNFFMDIAKEMYKTNPEIEFAVFTGQPELSSNNSGLVNRALNLVEDDSVNFKIYSGLKKNEYYELLADTQILFNCALQDWVSNTVSEADSLGVITIYPAYRSFPEVFANNPNHLYIPWSEEDAIKKIQAALDTITYPPSIVEREMNNKYQIGKISDYQDGTTDREIDIWNGDGEQWARNTLDYRKHVARKKY